MKNNVPQFSKTIPLSKTAARLFIKKPLELAKECRERGNRLEVMNGKVYEVERRFLGEVEN